MIGFFDRFFARPRNRILKHELRAIHAKQRARVRAERRSRLAGMAFLTLFLVAAVGWGAWAGTRGLVRRLFAENDAFQIRELSVESNGEVLKPDAVVAYLRLQRGQNLLAVDIARLRRDLELLPVVERAEVGRELPSRLVIRISERTPVASLVAGAGATPYQVDARGVVMDLFGMHRLSDAQRKTLGEIPVITGAAVADMKIGRPVISPEIYHALALFQRTERGDLVGGLEIRSIDVSRRGFLVVTTEEGCRARLAIADLDQQIRRWEAVLRDARTRALRVATIDLSMGRDVPVTFAAATPEAP